MYQEQSQSRKPKIFNIDCSAITRHQFIWQFFRFIIFNYYLIEVVLASSFYDIYLMTETTLMPLNIILFIYLGFDFLIKLACTAPPQFSKRQHYRKISKILKYYLIKRLIIIDVVFLILFISSYIVPYYLAKYFRYIIVIKLWDVADFNNKIYDKIHIYPMFRKVYTIIKIFYVILLFSHYFGTWFYLIDQVLLDKQFYGPPNEAYQLYYQMNLLAYTPIQQFGNGVRYLYGVYFMVSLITTIAYGDIIGKNPQQEVYVSVLMVLSTISLALILEQFMDLVRYDSLGLYDFIKNYNSLKTCMDDSQVPYSVQNKVRSYLVYAEYEKKYHAHQQVATKLTQRLQINLKKQSFSEAITKWIVPSMPELQQQINQICNICQLISFQAQTSIYEQLETVETATQCGFLYKLNGLVEQFIELPSNNISIPIQNRKQFNLSKLFLNFNLDVAYDSDQEDQEEFQIEKQPEQKQFKKYLLVTSHNRKLKSIKISQFIKLDAEEFYQFVNTKKLWFKRIKQIKQQILSQDFSLQRLGQYCTICLDSNAVDHSVQNCPMLHLTYNSRIKNGQKLTPIINSKQNRKFKKRKNLESAKTKNKSLFHRNLFSMIIQQTEEKSQQKQLMVNIFKNILNSITETNKQSQNTCDSVYDPEGLSQQFFLN